MYRFGLPVDEIKEEYTKFEIVARDVSSEKKQQFFIDEVFMAKKNQDGSISVNRAPTSNMVVLRSNMTQIGMHAVDATGISTLELKTLPKTEGGENDSIRLWNGAVQNNWSAVTYITNNRKYVRDGLTTFEKADTLFKNSNWKGLNPKIAEENEGNWVGKDTKNTEGGVYIVMVATADASGASSVKTMKFGVNYYASGDEYMPTGNGVLATVTPKTASSKSSSAKSSSTKSSSKASSSKSTKDDSSSSSSSGSSSGSSSSSSNSSSSGLKKLTTELSNDTNEDKTDAIKALQERLKYFGYSRLEVDGGFGKKTERAVLDFQRINGLTEDGVVGNNTNAALNNPNSKGPRDNDYQGTYVNKTLEKGDSGKEVYALQRRLNDLGYGELSVDGDFGPNTESAVQNFQTINKIDKKNGKVTDATLEILNSEDVVMCLVSTMNSSSNANTPSNELEKISLSARLITNNTRKQNGKSNVLGSGEKLQIAVTPTPKDFNVKITDFNWSFSKTDVKDNMNPNDHLKIDNNGLISITSSGSVYSQVLHKIKVTATYKNDTNVKADITIEAVY